MFRFDPDFLQTEKQYEEIKREILGDDEEDEDDEYTDDDDDAVPQAAQQQHIIDETNTNLSNLRRTIYLTNMSSISADEAVHKLLKLKVREGEEQELCRMIVDCSSKERTYMKHYGTILERFCLINRAYAQIIATCFMERVRLLTVIIRTITHKHKL